MYNSRGESSTVPKKVHKMYNSRGESSTVPKKVHKMYNSRGESSTVPKKVHKRHCYYSIHVQYQIWFLEKMNVITGIHNHE